MKPPAKPAPMQMPVGDEFSYREPAPVKTTSPFKLFCATLVVVLASGLWAQYSLGLGLFARESGNAASEAQLGEPAATALEPAPDAIDAQAPTVLTPVAAESTEPPFSLEFRHFPPTEPSHCPLSAEY